MSRAMNPRSVAMELPHNGAVRASGMCRRTYSSTVASASATVTVDWRTSGVRPELACISRTTSGMVSSTASSAWMTMSTPSSRMLSSESVTSTAISTSASLLRSRPVISQSIHTKLSVTQRSLARYACLISQLAGVKAWREASQDRLSPSGAMRMGKDVERTEFTRADRQRFREKVRLDLDVFAQMLKQSAFDTERPMSGLEVELNLVDEAGDPAMNDEDVVAAMPDPDFKTWLGHFNTEINGPPHELGPDGLAKSEDSLRASLNAAEEKANTVDTHILMIGILPTLKHEHMSADTLSANQRY